MDKVALRRDGSKSGRAACSLRLFTVRFYYSGWCKRSVWDERIVVALADSSSKRLLVLDLGEGMGAAYRRALRLSFSGHDDILDK